MVHTSEETIRLLVIQPSRVFVVCVLSSHCIYYSYTQISISFQEWDHIVLFCFATWYFIGYISDTFIHLFKCSIIIMIILYMHVSYMPRINGHLDWLQVSCVCICVCVSDFCFPLFLLKTVFYVMYECLYALHLAYAKLLETRRVHRILSNWSNRLLGAVCCGCWEPNPGTLQEP